jgi:cathepsin X
MARRTTPTPPLLERSWGTYWGEEGWLRILRGSNAAGVESGCNWAVPKL